MYANANMGHPSTVATKRNLLDSFRRGRREIASGFLGTHNPE